MEIRTREREIRTRLPCRILRLVVDLAWGTWQHPAHATKKRQILRLRIAARFRERRYFAQDDNFWVGRKAAGASAMTFSLRKEVIQPQVLLRLPCYDFTPIMNHTLDGCLPCGLARRLLVQSTFVM